MDAKILDQVSSATVGNVKMKLLLNISFDGNNPRTFQLGFTPKIVMFPWFTKMQGNTVSSSYNYREYSVAEWNDSSVSILVLGAAISISLAVFG